MRIIKIIQERGITYALKKIASRIKSSKLPFLSSIQPLVENKYGLEIGGPSKIFRPKGFIPIYNRAKLVDGCNFSTSTLWEGEISSDLSYHYTEGKIGRQFILEATDLSQIENETYDFLISSHCLEHVANPMKAIEEWLLKIKPAGLILLVLPHKDYCFDHKRSFTTFSHILNDYKNEVTEEDLTHLEEIMVKHDLSMDKPAGTPLQFRERSLKNFENRALHHHVFSVEVLKEIFNFFKIKILFSYQDENLIIAGTKAR